MTYQRFSLEIVVAKSEGGKEASINSPTSGMLRPGVRG